MLTPRRESARVRRTAYRDGRALPPEADVVAVEEPLEIRVSFFRAGRRETTSVAVTMRTPGDDFDLAVGFLFAEGLVRSRDEIREVTYCSGPEPQEYNVVEVRLAPGASFDPARLARNFYQTSSCGVCGKASLEALELEGMAPLPPGGIQVDPQVIERLPERLREAQPVFRETGGIHAAGLFDAGGELLGVREDVGRHNAVDKLLGQELLQGRLPLADRILVVSGRTSFELVQKGLAAGVPLVAAVGAPSSLAVTLAGRFGMTLIGFASPGGFNVYTGEERVSPD